MYLEQRSPYVSLQAQLLIASLESEQRVAAGHFFVFTAKCTLVNIRRQTELHRPPAVTIVVKDSHEP